MNVEGRMRAATLKMMIKDRHIAMTDLAHRLGVSRSYLSSFFTNPPEISPMYDKIYEAIEGLDTMGRVSLDYINNNPYVKIPVRKGHEVMWFKAGSRCYVIRTYIDGKEIDKECKNKQRMAKEIHNLCKKHRFDR